MWHSTCKDTGAEQQYGAGNVADLYTVGDKVHKNSAWQEPFKVMYFEICLLKLYIFIYLYLLIH